MYKRLTNFLKNTFGDRFKRYLIISLVVLGIVIGFTSQQRSNPVEGFEVHFFYLPGCSHCEDQELFNEKPKIEYPSINITAHDATAPAGRALLTQMLEGRGIEYEPGFPVTIFENQVFGGWVSENTSGRAIEEALQQCLAGNCPPPTGEEPRDTIVLPLIG